MKKMLLLIPLLLVSCGTEPVDPLGYQDQAFSARVTFSGDEEFRAIVSMTPVANGREFSLTLNDGLLSGVTFYIGENDYLEKDGMRIPIARQDGIDEMIGMFDISTDDFYSSEETPDGGVFVYTTDDGAKYEVTIVDSLPKRIIATLDGRTIIAEIDEFLPG